MKDYVTWKGNELDFRLAKVLISTLLKNGFINEDEAVRATENALSDLRPLIGMMEADFQ